MVSRWIQLPSSPVVLERSEPYLVMDARLDELRDFAKSVEASYASVDVTEADDAGSVIDALKQVLAFPDWCASSWDSIDDAFEELRQGWRFPLILAVEGLRSLVGRRPHLAMQVVLRLSELSHAFSVAGDQLVVVYVAESWD
jgi:hypothetical protein